MGTQATLGLVGARGWVAQELLALVARHPYLRLAWASSREWAGQPVAAHAPAWRGTETFEALGPDEVADRPVDICVLGLPNGLASPYVAALEHSSVRTCIVDLSADFRFDDQWVYGLVERHRDALRGATRIANPGCYATGIQLGLAPLLPLIAGVPRAFGVSGYSGAGTTPSPKNDPARLADSLMPYQLTDHTHEREVSRHLGQQVRFLPHVAPFFRGISLSLSADLTTPISREDVLARLRAAYEEEALVQVVEHIPEVPDTRNRPGVVIGGASVSTDGRALALVVSLDNLLKGAAVQAMQNVNLALGFPEMTSIPDPSTDSRPPTQ